ncbi:MAG: snoRNA-binding protein [Watsoniomyces obsoletus]|nr:MAG: snoRNA-binding protein [Watsoniomyces obsoletus]
MSKSNEAETKKENVRSSKGKISLKDRPVGALVPFAHPLADEKVAKKVFRGVKKAASQRTLKRGVKEVVKALRKSPTSAPANSLSESSSSSDLPLGIVILAADISPMDVISHIPVLCEDHNIPYIFVTSRAELGMAGMTKRPTSVVMISRDEGKKKEGEKKQESK